MRRDVFQAIADPTRRALILLIASQAMTPNAMAEHFEMSRQAISKHIQILNECDLLSQQKIGREIYYEIKSDKMIEIEKWLETFKQLISKRFDQLDQVLNKLKTERK